MTIVSEVGAPDSDSVMVKALRHFQLGGANLRLQPTGLHVADLEIQICDDSGEVLREVRQMLQGGGCWMTMVDALPLGRATHASPQ